MHLDIRDSQVWLKSNTLFRVNLKINIFKAKCTVNEIYLTSTTRKYSLVMIIMNYNNEWKLYVYIWIMWIKVKENIWKWTDISSCLNERETPVIKDEIK